MLSTKSEWVIVA